MPDPDGRSAPTVEAEAMAIREGVPQVVRGDVQQPAVPRQRALRPSTEDVTSTTVEAARPVRLLPQIAVVAANITSYANTNLTVKTQYWYRVRAINASVASAPSNTVSVRVR